MRSKAKERGRGEKAADGILVMLFFMKCLWKRSEHPKDPRDKDLAGESVPQKEKSRKDTYEVQEPQA